jgi:pimeloyl-ACP methyl ester carboxylesterase
LLLAAGLLVVVVIVVQLRAAAREASARENYPPSGQIVSLPEADIHLHVSGAGPDVVLIHGASGSLRDFTFDLAGRLAQDYRVIAVDRPGHGWSTRPLDYQGVLNTAAEPPELQARLLREAVAEVGVTRPVIVGHSYGAAVALAWALDAPDETAGLVLMGGASMPWPGELDRFYRLNASLAGSALVIPVLTAFAPRSRIETSTARIFDPQPMPAGYLEHFGPLRSLSRSSMRANAQQVNSLRPHLVEMEKRYPRLEVPVELLHGTADTTVPLDIHSEPIAEILPNAVLSRLEGTGHMPHHARPEETVAAIGRVAARAGLR